jgi:hypothetical protein
LFWKPCTDCTRERAFSARRRSERQSSRILRAKPAGVASLEGDFTTSRPISAFFRSSAVVVCRCACANFPLLFAISYLLSGME